MEKYNFYENRKREQNYEIRNSELFPNTNRGDDYIPSQGLIRAVNVAIMLQKPLLLTGLPGTGKSELAYHIARHFGWGEVECFNTRTDSTASDILYRYDSLAHFHKVNIDKGQGCELTAGEIEKQFISYVALGRAICDSIGYNKEKQARRSVVLIDEIDKAPRDLPNDILGIIETMSFEIPELKTAKDTGEPYFRKTGNTDLKPMVILTSNSEKTLPEAFLRRCVFFHIEMPDNDHLAEILLNKKNLFKSIDHQSAKSFIALFRKIERLVNGKKPATHELILWVWWMQKHGFTPEDIYSFREDKSTSGTQRNEILLSCISILVKETDDWTNVSDAVKRGEIKSDEK